MFYNEKLDNVKYFLAERFFNSIDFINFNKGKILAKEIVTFDCALTTPKEIDINNINNLNINENQILAIIINPLENVENKLKNEGFIFCGYDLVELATDISAITNCGAMFESINYKNLNEYGLISTYIEAKETQRKLIEEAPDESHAYCEIFEIWRKIYN